MNLITQAKQVFKTERPEHFTNFTHCSECEEHDQTLLAADMDTIGIEALGNPGWDPICFTSVEGKKYYLPALVRLSLETINDEFYFEQFLFHLTYDDVENELYTSCSNEQKKFIVDFIGFVIEEYAEILETNMCADDALSCHELWTGKAG